MPIMVCEMIQARCATAEHPGQLLGSMTELKAHELLFSSYQLGSHFDNAASRHSQDSDITLTQATM